MTFVAHCTLQFLDALRILYPYLAGITFGPGGPLLVQEAVTALGIDSTSIRVIDVFSRSHFWLGITTIAGHKCST